MLASSSPLPEHDPEKACPRTWPEGGYRSSRATNAKTRLRGDHAQTKRWTRMTIRRKVIDTCECSRTDPALENSACAKQAAAKGRGHQTLLSRARVVLGAVAPAHGRASVQFDWHVSEPRIRNDRDRDRDDGDRKRLGAGNHWDRRSRESAALSPAARPQRSAHQ